MSILTNTILRMVAGFLWTDGNINQNVFNVKITGGGGPFDDEDVIDDLVDWADNMYANMTAGMSDEIDGNSITVYKYDSVGQDWDEVGSDSWTFDPTSGGEQLPRGVAGLVRLWTTDPDVQGKKYIPGLTEASLTDGLFSPGLVVDFLALGADWYLPFVGATSGADFTPGVWSVVGELFVQGIDHIATSTIPAYQRRRKRNVGI